jgi:phosphoribosylanthranilate isomerase
MKVKICGLFRPEDVGYVNEVLPDYIGFVFAKSRRQVTAVQAAELKEKLDRRIKAVGVFVGRPFGRASELLKARHYRLGSASRQRGQPIRKTIKGNDGKTV